MKRALRILPLVFATAAAARDTKATGGADAKVFENTNKGLPEQWGAGSPGELLNGDGREPGDRYRSGWASMGFNFGNGGGVELPDGTKFNFGGGGGVYFARDSAAAAAAAGGLPGTTFLQGSYFTGLLAQSLDWDKVHEFENKMEGGHCKHVRSNADADTDSEGGGDYGSQYFSSSEGGSSGFGAPDLCRTCFEACLPAVLVQRLLKPGGKVIPGRCEGAELATLTGLSLQPLLASFEVTVHEGDGGGKGSRKTEAGAAAAELTNVHERLLAAGMRLPLERRFRSPHEVRSHLRIVADALSGAREGGADESSKGSLEDPCGEGGSGRVFCTPFHGFVGKHLCYEGCAASAVLAALAAPHKGLCPERFEAREGDHFHGHKHHEQGFPAGVRSLSFLHEARSKHENLHKMKHSKLTTLRVRGSEWLGSCHRAFIEVPEASADTLLAAGAMPASRRDTEKATCTERHGGMRACYSGCKKARPHVLPSTQALVLDIWE